MWLKWRGKNYFFHFVKHISPAHVGSSFTKDAPDAIWPEKDEDEDKDQYEDEDEDEDEGQTSLASKSRRVLLQELPSQPSPCGAAGYSWLQIPAYTWFQIRFPLSEALIGGFR